METVKQVNDVTTDNVAIETQTEKTFTQEELDSIVRDRLQRDRAKYADYEDLKAKAAKLDEIEEASKTELQKATERATALQQELDALKNAEMLRVMRAKVAEETGVPANLLTGETEDACKAQAEEVLKFAKPQAYPAVKDNGEVGGTHKTGTREKFAEWFNQI